MTVAVCGISVSFPAGAAHADNPGFLVAFQANTNAMYLTPGGSTGQGMLSGTSPSIVALPGGGYEAAFQANTGKLVLFGSFEDTTGLPMHSGSSPAIAVTSSGAFEVAYEGSDANLHTFTVSGGDVVHQQGMYPGTSPAIAALTTGSFEIAVETNEKNLLLQGPVDYLGLGLDAATSPAIAPGVGGAFEVAFQSNENELWTFSSGVGHNTTQGMKAGTSPAIAGLSDGKSYEEAFQANTGNLIAFGTLNFNSGNQMWPTSSPAIAAGASANAFTVAYEVNTKDLYEITSSSRSGVSQGLGMLAGTTPSIVPTTSGGGSSGSHPCYKPGSYCWGIDTVDTLTTSEIAAIKSAEGAVPDFAGRYIVGASSSYQLNSTDIQTAKADNFGLALLVSGPNIEQDETGSAALGASYADTATQNASALALKPASNVALYLDVEAGVNISVSFMQGFADESVKDGWRAGFYASEQGSFASTFCTAASDANVSASLIFSSSPDADGTRSTGRSTEAGSPAFDPDETQCSNGTTVMWQYGEPTTDDTSGANVPPAVHNGPDVDTDEITSSVPGLMYVS